MLAPEEGELVPGGGEGLVAVEEAGRCGFRVPGAAHAAEPRERPHRKT